MRAKKRADGVLQRAWIHRADYLYVLPALVVMLVVIAYPVYYTSRSPSSNTPPSLQLKDKEFIGIDNYTLILSSEVFWQVTLNTFIWTIVSTGVGLYPGARLRARAPPRFRRPRHPARHPDHSLGDHRGGGLLHLEMDLPFQLGVIAP